MAKKTAKERREEMLNAGLVPATDGKFGIYGLPHQSKTRKKIDQNEVRKFWQTFEETQSSGKWRIVFTKAAHAEMQTLLPNVRDAVKDSLSKATDFENVLPHLTRAQEVKADAFALEIKLENTTRVIVVVAPLFARKDLVVVAIHQRLGVDPAQSAAAINPFLKAHENLISRRLGKYVQPKPEAHDEIVLE